MTVWQVCEALKDCATRRHSLTVTTGRTAYEGPSEARAGCLRMDVIDILVYTYDVLRERTLCWGEWTRPGPILASPPLLSLPPVPPNITTK